MTETAAPAPRLPARSMGRKLLLVCGLALLMTIPAFFVFGVLGDRSVRARSVADEIGGLVGGPQTFLGPVLTVPYTAPAAPQAGPTRDPATGAIIAPAPAPGAVVSGLYVVFPAVGSATVKTHSELRRRALFKVPVYESEIVFDARFDLAQAAAAAPARATLDWSRAELVVGASDPRGAQSDVTFAAGGRTVALAPARNLSDQEMEPPQQPRRSYSPPGDRQKLRFFGTPWPEPTQPFQATARMKFSGAERIAVLPFAKTTTVRISGDWAHPSFDGSFLPTDRAVRSNGFDATWNVPFIARGVPAQGQLETLSRLGAAALGVSFVEPANPYQSVSRSLKYAPLFIGLVFLTFFVFEITTGRRVHPAQYVLVGLAQVIFYLLLLAVAEHLGFDLGFLIAAVATVALLSAYAGWAFESRPQGLRALAVFALLYLGIYVLMRLEDYALLVGAVASFLAVAAVMWFTRKVDWYGLTDAAPPVKTRPVDFGPT